MRIRDEDIRRQLRLGEDRQWEFKQIEFRGDTPTRPRRDDWADELGAFGNANGGIMLCGVSDDGIIQGMSRSQMAALDRLSSRRSPRLWPRRKGLRGSVQVTGTHFHRPWPRMPVASLCWTAARTAESRTRSAKPEQRSVPRAPRAETALGREARRRDPPLPRRPGAVGSCAAHPSTAPSIPPSGRTELGLSRLPESRPCSSRRRGRTPPCAPGARRSPAPPAEGP